MALIHAPLSRIGALDLNRLVQARASEARDIEYKRETYGGTAADHAEWLADVSSFANTAGGDLVIGMEAEAGRAAGNQHAHALPNAAGRKEHPRAKPILARQSGTPHAGSRRSWHRWRTCGHAGRAKPSPDCSGHRSVQEAVRYRIGERPLAGPHGRKTGGMKPFPQTPSYFLEWF
jgi:hypothetical protein